MSAAEPMAFGPGNSHCQGPRRVVHRRDAQLPDTPRRPGRARTLIGSTRLRRSPTMKNFARLVRFAWPYRVRFGLSLACAVMVALLWSFNISAVLPLLKILFYSENCQK